MMSERRKYLYFTIHPDGRVTCDSHMKTPDYRVIQQYVNGSFELVPYFSSFTHDGVKYSRGTAYCNMEGKLTGMPFNPYATKAWMAACPKGDPRRMAIAGPLLFVVKEKVNAETS